MTAPLRYYNKTEEDRKLMAHEASIVAKETRQTDFLLARKKHAAVPSVVREYTPTDDVARITVQVLSNKAGVYYQQLRDWRPQLKFEFLDRVKALDELPHLGFASITKGMIPEKHEAPTPWIFYFANFNCRFGTEEELFVDIKPSYGACFFALALTVGPDGMINGRDRRKRGNGLLFATRDPNEAFLAVSKMRTAQLIQFKAMQESLSSV